MRFLGIVLILFCLMGCVREIGENWILVIIPIEATTTTTTAIDLYVPQGTILPYYDPPDCNGSICMPHDGYPPPGNGSTLWYPQPLIDWEELVQPFNREVR